MNYQICHRRRFKFNFPYWYSAPLAVWVRSWPFSSLKPATRTYPTPSRTLTSSDPNSRLAIAWSAQTPKKISNRSATTTQLPPQQPRPRLEKEFRPLCLAYLPPCQEYQPFRPSQYRTRRMSDWLSTMSHQKKHNTVLEPNITFSLEEPTQEAFLFKIINSFQ